MRRSSALTPERVLLFAMVVAVVIYWRDLTYDFILDDVPLILTSPAITSWRNLPRLFLTHIFSGVGAPVNALHYRPVYMSWLMLNHALFGMAFPWWHLSSLLLHLAVTFVVYQLGKKILKEPWLASFAAALFLLHPIHAEAVAYVTASSDELVALLSGAALLLYFRFREGGRPVWLVGSLAAAAGAMLCKESAGMFPFLLVAYETLLSPEATAGTGRWRRYRWTLPYFAVVAGYVAVRIWLFGFNAGPGPGGSRIAALWDVPLVGLVYLRNLFLPMRLSFYYPAEWSDHWTVLRGVAVVAVLLTVAFIWRRYKSNEVRPLLAWTAILLVPPALAVTTFIRDEWVHDRHVYWASIPICLLLARLLADLLPQPKRLAIVSAAALLLLAIVSVYRVPDFRDEVSVYASALKVADSSPMLHHYYAVALWSRNRREEALQQYRVMTAITPDSPFAHGEYAGALAQSGREAEAWKEYQTALQLAPSASPMRASILYRIAEIEMRLARPETAEARLREATQIAPEMMNYHAALAAVLRQQGKTAEAEEALRIETANRKLYLEKQRLELR